jgi:hypothetical protein
VLKNGYKVRETSSPLKASASFSIDEAKNVTIALTCAKK